jgi:hypothetical protein
MLKRLNEDLDSLTFLKRVFFDSACFEFRVVILKTFSDL